MIVFPAIDLRKGRVVRLRQGDPEAETVYGEDPVAIARRWAAQGAEWLHVVNLDGAFRTEEPESETGEEIAASDLHKLPVNLQRLADIRRAVDIPIQFGGGLRSLADIGLALRLGATRVVLGTAAVRQPSLVAQALDRFGAERIVVGIDAREGRVAVFGWQDLSEMTAIELAQQMAAMGVPRFVYTDIQRDGMLSGVNVQATAELAASAQAKVIASGGVRSLRDIQALKSYEHWGIEGLITGQAIYSGALNLAEAIELAKGPVRHTSAVVIPYRRRRRSVSFLLLHSSLWNRWHFPRCSVPFGESEWEMAARRLREQTGLDVVRRHPDFRYETHRSTQRQAYTVERRWVYFLAEVSEGPVRVPKRSEDNERITYRWVDMGEARELLMMNNRDLLPALEAAFKTLLEGADG